MKILILKRVFIFLLLFLCHVSYSQTEKGKFLIGSQYVLNFSSYTSSYVGQSNSYGYGRYKTLAINPMAAFFIFDRIPAGLELQYSNGWSDDGTTNSHSISYIFIPFARYYFGKSNVKPYLQLGAGEGWTIGRTVEFGYTSTSKIKLFAYDITGGLAAFINENISIDLSLGYKATLKSNHLFTTAGNTESRLLTKNLQAQVGFVVCL